jgi:8-oxo-dGTP pyrophosphatase MutT (NUDIX family)
MYRICSQPVSSFGIVCYRAMASMDPIDSMDPMDPPASTASMPDASQEYLMVQRKDSLSFVEFIRGKYNVQNRGYILRLLSNMTTTERARLVTCDFDKLWHGFWQSDHNRSFMKEYEQSKGRFAMLRKGYYLRTAPVIGVPPTTAASPAALVFFGMEVALRDTRAEHADTEFGFPKGRRNINESDLQCALREFSEETGISSADVQVLPGVRAFEEVFTGSNNVRYRHVYYIARLRPGVTAWGHHGVMPVVDAEQLREVKAVGWFDAAGVLERIRPANVERRDAFSHMHRHVSAALLQQREASPLNPHAVAFTTP